MAMRRRNLVAAVISILLLLGFLALMIFVAFSTIITGFDILDRLVLSGVNVIIWIAISLLAAPVFLFVILTIIWLTMEARRATQDVSRATWLAPKAHPEISDLDHQYTTGQISQQEYIAEKERPR